MKVTYSCDIYNIAIKTKAVVRINIWFFSNVHDFSDIRFRTDSNTLLYIEILSTSERRRSLYPLIVFLIV